MSEPKDKRRKDGESRRRHRSRSISPDWRSKAPKPAVPRPEERLVDKREHDRGRRKDPGEDTRSRKPGAGERSHARPHEDSRGQRPPRHGSSSPPPRNRGRGRRGRSPEGKQHWGKVEPKEEPEEKVAVKPDFGLSGKLAEDTNVFNGVVIKYNEPVEARKPKRRWRLYPFKGDTSLPFIPLHRQSAYLLGRSRMIADIPIDHPSCSKQHAVLQFRLVEFTRDDGTTGRRIRPYVIDLESANGTFVNNKRIDARRYVELLERDVLKFGFSTREYVVLHEESHGEDQDDDVNGPAAEDAVAAEGTTAA
ncbi:smad nuclear-interacting protein 1 [Ixodes scapularis]|nr:smad nuclear-interacting protein 1 [Ixodes scapularis]